MKQISLAAHCSAEDVPARPQIRSDHSFPPASRWDVLTVARALRRDLKLTPGDIAVLQALLSFLPCKASGSAVEQMVTSTMLLVVFPSNASLADRAHGMDPRCLRRHLANLENAGLIKRRRSANGKRFPLRHNGKIVDAFGIDLTTGFIALPSLRERANALSREAEEARNLRSEIRAVRQELFAHAHAHGETLLAWLDEIGRWLRRSLGVDELRSLLARLQAHLSTLATPAGDAPSDSGHRAPPSITREPDTQNGEACNSHVEKPGSAPLSTNAEPLSSDVWSARDGQNVRHKELEKRVYSKQETVIDWARVPGLREYFPDKPKNYSELIYVLEMACRCIGLRQEKFKWVLQSVGAQSMLESLNLVFERAERLHNPAGYFLHLVSHPSSTTARSSG